MFISPAYAQAAGEGASAFTSLLPLILIFVVFYLLLIRPQQKKMKEHRNMVANVRRNDKVVTAGGMIGTVTKVVSDTELELQIAEGVKVRVIKATISDVLSKSEPASDEKGAATPTPANDSGGGGLLAKLLGGGNRKN